MPTLATNRELAQAQASFDGQTIRVTTGTASAIWTLLPDGIGLTSLRDAAGPERIDRDGEARCDWSLRGVTGGPVELGPIDIRVERDRCDTADHLLVTVPAVDRAQDLALRLEISVYPGAPGLRTQLVVRSLRPRERHEQPAYLGPSFAARLRLARAPQRVVAVGYHCDTQHRNWAETPLLRERHLAPDEAGDVDWASLIILESDTEALAVVKESHKCVNQSGVDTGAFHLRNGELVVTGLGICDHRYGSGDPWYRSERERRCWATWLIPCAAGAPARAAIKAMDRARYPFRPERDTLIASNTWGSGGAGEGSRAAACEAVVLAELETAAELGVDLVQIDDGWQCAAGEPRPFHVGWEPHPSRWPQGWGPVRERAAELGVALGLWQPWNCPADAVVANADAGGFRRFKIDFVDLHTPDEVEALLDHAAELVARLGPEAGINWDATEEQARMGYLFGRDHGNVYLANRPAPPAGDRRLAHVAYEPWLTLREAWHLARYLNLNQFQISIQDPTRVAPESGSGARHHPQAYAVAIALMGLPLFFQEIHRLDPTARKEIASLLRIYRAEREQLLAGWVEPIGDEPCDGAWTGFRNHGAVDDRGYLLVFRERSSQRPDAGIHVDALAGTTLALHDLERDTTGTATIGADGHLPLRIDDAPGYRFLRYTVT